MKNKLTKKTRCAHWCPSIHFVRFLVKPFMLMVMCLSFMITSFSQRYMEKIERGLVAVKVTNGVYLSWRILGDEWSQNLSYAVYRNGAKITTISSTGASNYTDVSGTNTSTYYIRAIVGGVEQPASVSTPVWAQFYKSIPLSQVAGDPNWEYQINDVAIGDLDGDGHYEFIVKRLPPDSEFVNSFLSNRTSRLEAYKMDGTKLWEVDLGVNVNYPVEDHPIVYDLDSDGKAEIAIRTSEGTKFANGTIIGDVNGDGRTNYRPASPGYINEGPQFLSIINGAGNEAARTDYIARNPVTDYGDDWGHRANKYLSAVAYLDGVRPSIVMCRGYYPAREGKGKCVLSAWDYRNNQFTNRWTFTAVHGGQNSAYVGQGNHNLAVGDVDNDGFDEIIYGAMVVDHNGTGKYSTGLGHGDAINFSDLNPDRPGLEVFQPHEFAAGATLRDANTGQILTQFLQSASGDIPRGCAADIDGIKGADLWCNGGYLYDLDGSTKGNAPPYATWLVWWDGDESREIANGTVLDKYINGGISRRVTFYNYGVDKINGTKNTPCLGGDILGDWREEMVFRDNANRNIVIFTTTTPTNRRLYTLMHDPIYRLSMAWQPVTYNQPPHPGFYLGAGMNTPPTPNIRFAGSCATTAINPYVQVNDGAWQNTSSVTVASGAKVKLGPQPVNGGSWGWSGCGVSGTTREQTLYPTSSCAPLATYTNSCGAKSTLNFTLTISGNTARMPEDAQSITSKLEEELTLYPNPAAHGKFTLELPGTYINTHIQILNIQGKVVFENSLHEAGKISIDQTLEAGIYLVKIRASNSTITRKLVVH